MTTPLPEPYPCGHADREKGCGGCDPGAVEFVRDDGGPWRKVDELTIGVTPINEGRRHVMPRTLTLG